MNVLITRPDERGQQLLEMLSERHIFAIHQPLFQVESGVDLPLLPLVLSGLNAGDYVFAVSKNAIDFAHNTLKETGFSWREDLHYFAVGQRSASYFSSQIERAVRYPLNAENSEGLLELPEMHQAAGKNVLILRADSGREQFAETIAARGANVRTLECYKRVPLSDNLPDRISLAKRAGIDTILLTSCEMLAILLENTFEADREWLLGCQLVVVSARIAKAAEALGWQSAKVFIAERADNQTLLQTILKHQIS